MGKGNYIPNRPTTTCGMDGRASELAMRAIMELICSLRWGRPAIDELYPPIEMTSRALGQEGVTVISQKEFSASPLHHKRELAFDLLRRVEVRYTNRTAGDFPVLRKIESYAHLR